MKKSKKPKEYIISDFEDMYNCLTPENVENYIECMAYSLRQYTKIVYTIRKEVKELKGMCNTEIIMPEPFTYIDDGLTTGELTIKIITK